MARRTILDIEALDDTISPTAKADIEAHCRIEALLTPDKCENFHVTASIIYLAYLYLISNNVYVIIKHVGI